MLDAAPTVPLADHGLERQLVAELIADNAGLDRLGQLTPDDLEEPVHAAVLAAMLDLHAERRPANLTTLRARFTAVPFGDHASVLEYLRTTEINGNRPDVVDTAAALKELSQRRAIAQIGERIAGSVHDHAASPTTLLTDAAREIDEQLAKCRPAGRFVWNMPEGVQDLLETTDDADKCITTGLTDVNQLLGGGLRRGELSLLGGRPSMGKTALGLSIGRQSAIAGHGVCFFSLEMSSRECLRRMATDACWERNAAVQYQAARSGRLSPADRTAYRRGARSLERLPILIVDRAGLTVADISSETRRAAEHFARHGQQLGFVIVDHLGHVAPSSHYRGNRTNEVGEISLGMLRIAKAEQVAVLALHQLNRATESRDNKRPTLADLRDSGTLEQDAHVVMFAYRSAYYLERMETDDPEAERVRVQKLEVVRNVLELIVAKQRNGPVGTVNLFCDIAANAIRDAARTL